MAPRVCPAARWPGGLADAISVSPDVNDEANRSVQAAARSGAAPDEVRNAVYTTITAIAPDADVRYLRPDLPLRQQIDLDSIDWLNVLAQLQERLSIEIPESDYARLTTLDAIVAYVASRQGEQSGAPQHAAAPASAALPHEIHLVSGAAITLRPMRADDMPREAEFIRHLSKESRYNRFMVTLGELSPAKLKYLTDVDQTRHVALVATADRQGQEVLLGVVRYIIDPDGAGCEFAIAIDDAWQRSGLAGILMQALMDVARARGLRTMEGFVLATNRRMLKFVRQLGFGRQRDPDAGDAVRVVRTL
jgi:acyl carrier protein/GNAT superfamily N-acetyltransferase